MSGIFDPAIFDPAIFDTVAVAKGGAGDDEQRRERMRPVIVHFVDDEPIPTETPSTEVVAPTTPYPKRKDQRKAKPVPQPAQDDEEEALMLLLAA